MTIVETLNRDPEFSFKDGSYLIGDREVASFEPITVYRNGRKQTIRTLSTYPTDKLSVPVDQADATWLLYVNPKLDWLQGARRFQPELDNVESIATYMSGAPRVEPDPELERVLQLVRGVHELRTVKPNSLSTRARKAIYGAIDWLLKVPEPANPTYRKRR